MNQWILISIFIVALAAIIGLVLMFVLWKKKKEEQTKEIDYQVFFSIGIIWIPAGIVFLMTINPALGFAFIALGVSYLAIGLANKDKWKKKR